ncbi:transposable element Tcb2 transposase [Trichonephila clavipes]|nr:transposable element Tcb2 transposase [Trichonephila clavipes]
MMVLVHFYSIPVHNEVIRPPYSLGNYEINKFTCRNCGGGDRGHVAIYRPFGEVSLSLNRTVTCMVLKANDRRTSCPCHDEFRGPRFYVRHVALATTTKIWNRLLETGSAGRRPGQGRRWATTPNEDRYLVLTARRHRNMNATLLQQHLRSATGTRVSTQTVRNRLHGVVPFSIQQDNRRIFIWRDRGSRNNPAFMHESVIFGGGGVLVYGGISIDGRTDLYIVRDGPLTARRYRDEILRPIVVP